MGDTATRPIEQRCGTLAALLFLYGQVLKVELPWLDEVTAARAQRKLPVVLTPSEVRALLMEMSGVTSLVAAMLYGTGMRLPSGKTARVRWGVRGACAEPVERQRLASRCAPWKGGAACQR